MGKIIAVASGKGGTGKSTVCVGLGCALAENGNKVLLIDCDCGMRGLDLMTGISKKLVFDISDAACGDCNTEDVIYPCESISGLYLTPAPQKAEEELSPAVFKEFLDCVVNVFDYIIVDSPAGVGTGFKTAVSSADEVLVVCNAEPSSVRGCAGVKKNLLEYGVGSVRLVINKFNEKKFLNSNFYKDLDSVIDNTQIQLIAVIPEDRKMSSQVQCGNPDFKNGPAKKAFSRLADRLCGKRVQLKI